MGAQRGNKSTLPPLAEVNRLYNEGHSLGELATAFGISEATIRSRLSAAGYTPRPKSQKQKPAKRFISERDEWQGLCYGYDPELWFSTKPEEVAKAKGICARCDYRMNCLNLALRAEGGNGIDSRAGIYGGLTEGERVELSRSQRQAS